MMDEPNSNGGIDESSDEPTTAAGRAIHDHVDMDQLMDDLEGRSGLRVSKPDADGLTQFIWRMARFHGSHDPAMPVMAHSWLQTYLDENGIDAKVTGVMNDAGHEVTSEVQRAVDAVLEGFDEDPAAAAKTWKQAGAF